MVVICQTGTALVSPCRWALGSLVVILLFSSILTSVQPGRYTPVLSEAVDTPSTRPISISADHLELVLNSSKTTRDGLINGSACQLYHPSDEVVILRLYGPFTEKKQAVITRYITELGNARHLWLLYDVSSAGQGEREELELSMDFFKSRSRGTFNVFFYDKDVELHLFPTLKDRLADVEVNYWVYAVSIVSWWRTCGRHNWGDPDEHAPNPKYIWVLEMDAGFSGNTSTFLDYYSNKMYDVIIPWSFVAEADWLEWRKGMVHDDSNLPQDAYYYKAEFVQRFSSRFLYHVDTLLQAHVMYYGECYELTLCRSVFRDWCRWRNFADDGFGGEVLIWNGRVSSEDWAKYNQETPYLNKWYHALLDFKEHRRIRGR